MPYDKDTLCNMAVGHIGIVGTISDVDNERSNEARQCRLFYNHVRDFLFTVCEWPFATTSTLLSSLGTPPTNWLFRYDYPANCALAHRIINPLTRTPNNDQKIPFQIRYDTTTGNKVILCDTENAELLHNVVIANEAAWSPAFAHAHSLGVAANIAKPLRVDPNIINDVRREWDLWLQEAINQKQREQTEDREPESELERVRR